MRATASTIGSLKTNSFRDSSSFWIAAASSNLPARPALSMAAHFSVATLATPMSAPLAPSL